MSDTKRILLVEDDAPSVRVMRLILEPEGYELDVGANREEALQLMERQEPALVIMDFLMDGLPPADFIDRVRERGFQGPIVLCTAMHDDLGLPVDDVIHKPFDPDEVPRKLATLLRAKGGSA